MNVIYIQKTGAGFRGARRDYIDWNKHIEFSFFISNIPNANITNNNYQKAPTSGRIISMQSTHSLPITPCNITEFLYIDSFMDTSGATSKFYSDVKTT